MARNPPVVRRIGDRRSHSGVREGSRNRRADGVRAARLHRSSGLHRRIDIPAPTTTIKTRTSLTPLDGAAHLRGGQDEASQRKERDNADGARLSGDKLFLYTQKTGTHRRRSKIVPAKDGVPEH